MILRQILILIISALVLFFSYRYYSNKFCPTCCSPVDNVSGIGADAASISTSPLLFNWNNEEAITAEGFDELRMNILSKGEEGEAIEITGHYFADEENNTEYEDLGKARAAAVGELLVEEREGLVPILKSKIVEMIDGADTTAFESISYEWISDQKGLDIEENELGETKILFPFNSSDKVENAEVDQYLDRIAEQLKSDKNQRAYLVGHTDSRGEPGPNRTLSERRAKKIRDILRSKGVSRRQIVTSGRGEADPVAPNTNESDRRLNRRVEVIIE